MGKSKNRKSNKESEGPSISTIVGKREEEVLTHAGLAPGGSPSNSTNLHLAPPLSPSRRSLYQWCLQEREGILWVLGCALIGSVFGFSIGSGLLTGKFGETPSPWRVALGIKIRQVASMDIPKTIRQKSWEIFVEDIHYSDDDAIVATNPYADRDRAMTTTDAATLRSDPSHPSVYAVLREAVVREKGGFVHPDLGILQPAPSGAARGLGMIREEWNTCQNVCNPGIAKEKLQAKRNETDSTTKNNYRQEEVLLKIPLGFQMTRSAALDTLLPLISVEVQRKASIHELDDAALLVLFLAHERGVGKYSRWLPYIASLPLQPSCGYSADLRPYLLDTIQALKDEMGMDVSGWPAELKKATQYADKIATGLARDYGAFLMHPEGMSPVENIEWALCQVASRGTAGSQEHGSLRMIPLADMINHDENAGGFVELTGKERLENGDFVDAAEDDSGAFVVRSIRHGRRKALKRGQELLVNYNVPHYSALDWFVSLGFVPPERWNKWQKLDAALPRVRRDGPILAPRDADGQQDSTWKRGGGTRGLHNEL